MIGVANLKCFLCRTFKFFLHPPQVVYCECLSPVVLRKELCNLSTAALDATYLYESSGQYVAGVKHISNSCTLIVPMPSTLSTWITLEQINTGQIGFIDSEFMLRLSYIKAHDLEMVKSCRFCTLDLVWRALFLMF